MPVLTIDEILHRGNFKVRIIFPLLYVNDNFSLITDSWGVKDTIENVL